VLVTRAADGGQELAQLFTHRLVWPCCPPRLATRSAR
jgi:hypothetical protein